MSGQIIGLAPGMAPTLDPWLQQGAGGYVRDWAKSQYQSALADIFGYHALQLGASSLNTLASSRIPHRWCAVDMADDKQSTFYATASALPFFESKIDLITLPFTLDLHSDPETVLDEVARVLVPEGKVVICGFNRPSLWSLSSKFYPEGTSPFGYKALLASLQELGLSVQSTQFGGYVPAVQTEQAAKGYVWLDKMGSRWWPSFSGLYFVVATKRVVGVKPRPHRTIRLPKFSDLSLNPFPSPSPKGLRSKVKKQK
jgi:SAM-dependent methyltransferase